MNYFQVQVAYTTNGELKTLHKIASSNKKIIGSDLHQWFLDNIIFDKDTDVHYDITADANEAMFIAVSKNDRLSL